MSDESIKQEILQKFGNQLRLRVSGICCQNEQVLLIKHHYLGEGKYLWSPPGGGMHFGDSANETLVREFWEETNLQIEVGEFLFVNEFLQPPLHAIELFFAVKIVGGELKRGFDPEMSAENQIIHEVKFLSLDDLQKENPLQIHSIFRNIQKLSNILQRKGYFQTHN
ncbi:MAG: NUDIX hydrolase [Microscillaceae bacterium]|jgi:8-oxo-dGTP diphosphatase|nr:NUDIX hydrolase [Microscillaceae bacterium]